VTALEAETVVPPDPDPDAEHQKPSTLRNVVEWVVILVAALLVAFVVKTFLIQAFYIPSPSMVPTLEINDRVLVNKLSYRLHDVHRGDVIVFERLPAEHAPIKDLIKRVVAVEGDTIESRGNTLFVNDQAVDEPYLRTSSFGEPVKRMTIPPNRVFVMGDNRGNSSDARVNGPIKESSIVGRVFVRIWPLNRLGFL
jgi:signal peptidase I